MVARAAAHQSDRSHCRSYFPSSLVATITFEVEVRRIGERLALQAATYSVLNSWVGSLVFA